MSISFDPRQPVLVGIGTCMQRENDLACAGEPMELMLEAVRRAGEDPALVQRMQSAEFCRASIVMKGDLFTLS